VSGPDAAALEAVEDRLALLPTEHGLGPELENEFRRRRARVHQRYNEWRRGMPGLDELFLDDEHRAKALAGSLATELARVLELQGAMAAAAGIAIPDDWPRACAAEWLSTAGEVADCWPWDAAARNMFRLVIDEISAQAVAQAEVGERPRSARGEVHISRLRRWVIMSGRLVGRFFRPAPQRR
jgi:hypothetical protein